MIERLFVLNQGVILSFMHLTFSFNLSDTIKLDETLKLILLATSTDSTLTSFVLLLLKILASSVFWTWVQVACFFCSPPLGTEHAVQIISLAVLAFLKDENIWKYWKSVVYRRHDKCCHLLKQIEATEYIRALSLTFRSPIYSYHSLI